MFSIFRRTRLSPNQVTGDLYVVRADGGMIRVESISNGKLRAACDRCHELKNRCTRSGGPDSRCDRCERLDIDCVYQTSARMGRPRASRPAPDNSASSRSSGGESPGRHAAKRRAVQSEMQCTSKPVSVDYPDSGSGNSPGNIDPMLGLLDPALLPEGTGWPWTSADEAQAKLRKSYTEII